MESINDDPLETFGQIQREDSVAAAQPDKTLLLHLWERLDDEGRELLVKVTLRMLGVSYNTEPR